MATIRNRNGRYQAQVRVAGRPPVFRTFGHKLDAKRWAQAEETRLRAASPARCDKEQLLRTMTVSAALTRYGDEITPRKRSAPEEEKRIKWLQKKSSLAPLLLKDVDTVTVAAWRNERLKQVSGSTVNRDWTLFSHMFTIAQIEWGLPVDNPFPKVEKPKENPGRERRFLPGEECLLLEACADARNKWLKPLVILAIETAIRRGELLKVEWSFINWQAHTIYLPPHVTKTGKSRSVPMTECAEATLQALPRLSARVFHGVTTEAAKLSWQRAKKRAGIKDFRFHDLRHEATSRLFEKGMELMEVASITGHRDLSMLLRYTHLRPNNLAAKLRAA